MARAYLRVPSSNTPQIEAPANQLRLGNECHHNSLLTGTIIVTSLRSAVLSS